MFRRVRAPVALAVGLATVGSLPAPPQPAWASSGQIAMFQDDLALYTDPGSALQTLRRLGVGTVRVSVRWSELAPAPTARRPPPGFVAADPGSYSAAIWARYDTIVSDAEATGIGIDFVVGGPAPRWASGPGAPRGGPFPQWRPSAKAYGQFFEAIASRFSGGYRPAGAASPLPRVHFWEIWNEPNFGQDLAPQALENSKVAASPAIYRQLLGPAWAALQRTGHGRDTILIGGLSPRGFQAPQTKQWPQGLPGNFSTTKPLRFIRALYCVGTDYRPLQAGAATTVGCPSTASGSRRFAADNPALFHAGGFGIHPYPYGTPPTTPDSRDPDYAEFSELPRLARTLERVLSAYGSRRRLPVYNTEYGYITSPPRRGSGFVSPATAAYYMNWAEYLSWRDPRIASTMQYLLNDPNPSLRVPEYGGFASGLAFFNHRRKPAYSAYRLPIFLPLTTTTPGRDLTVWGCVRPAHYAQLDAHGAQQSVQIQLRRGLQGPFRTLRRVVIDDLHGYFEVRIAFPVSGTVRLAWSYPDGQLITSRLVEVRVH